MGALCRMLVVADTTARSLPHPPLPCCRIIFNVLDHAAAGAGGRRLQKERVLKKGQPPTLQTSQTSCSPNSQRPWHCQWFPRLTCRWQWRLRTPHTQPLDLVQHVIFLFPAQGSSFPPRGPLWQVAFAPSNSQFPATGTKFSLLICAACPGPGKSPGWAWTWPLLKLVGTCCRKKIHLPASTSRVGHGQPAARVSRVVLGKAVEVWESATP